MKSKKQRKSTTKNERKRMIGKKKSNENTENETSE